jgi:hypothetical protein
MKNKLKQLCEANKDLLTDYQIMTFGKHKGKKLSEVPNDYLMWLVELENLDLNWRDSVAIELNRREV